MDSIQRIKDFLKIDEASYLDYEILYNYAVLHEKFEIEDIYSFYIENLNTTIKFEEKITLTEIISNCSELMRHLPISFYSLIKTNEFIIKNTLGLNLLSSETELLKFNSSFVPSYYLNLNFRINCDEKVKECIHGGLISPLACDLNGKKLRLNKATFSYLVETEIDIAELMAYDMNYAEMDIIIKAILTNIKFRDECVRFIQEQGILNSTMLILASLCGIFNLKYGDLDIKKVCKLYCQEHFTKVYIPFSKIEGIHDLSKLEIYYLYIANKKDLTQDVPDIIQAIESEEMNIKTCCDSNIIQELNKVPLSFSLPSLTLSSSFNPPDRSIKASLLHYLFKNCQNIPFNPKVFKHLNELYNEDYFQTVCRRYAQNIIQSNIFIQAEIFINEITPIVNFLKMQENISDHHFFESDLSQKIKNDQINEALDHHLPMIDFKNYPWLTKRYSELILNYYIRFWDKYSLIDLSENFLCEYDFSSEICDFFKKRHREIRDNVLKGRIMCKLDIEVDHKMFTNSEIKGIMECSKRIFGLKKYLFSNKVQKKYFDKFFNSIDDDKIDLLIDDIYSNMPNEAFCIHFLGFLFKKYEFSFINPILLHLIDHREPTIIKGIQKLVIGFLDSMFIEESYLEPLILIYKKSIVNEEIQIKKNNDKILSMIAKACKLLGKEPFLGNIRVDI